MADLNVRDAEKRARQTHLEPGPINHEKNLLADDVLALLDLARRLAQNNHEWKTEPATAMGVGLKVRTRLLDTEARKAGLI